VVSQQHTREKRGREETNLEVQEDTLRAIVEFGEVHFAVQSFDQHSIINTQVSNFSLSLSLSRPHAPEVLANNIVDFVVNHIQALLQQQRHLRSAHHSHQRFGVLYPKESSILAHDPIKGQRQTAAAVEIGDVGGGSLFARQWFRREGFWTTDKAVGGGVEAELGEEVED
jgi:hypothetical protein